MNKKDRMLIAGIILLSILLAFTVVLIFNEKNKTSLYQENLELRRIDDLLSKGYREDAEKAIRSLSKKDLSAVSHLRLLKRARQFDGDESVGDDAGSRDLLIETAARAYKEYPTGKGIAAVYIYALLRKGESGRAVEIAEEAELDGERWTALLNELHLYGEPTGSPGSPGSKGETTDAGTEENTDLMNLSRESGAERFADIYRRTGSTGFLQDAVLLYLENGQIDAAYRMAAGEQLPQKLLFFMSYDAGDWDRSMNILIENPGLFKEPLREYLRADVLMQMERYGEAAAIYTNLFEIKFPENDAGETELSGKERALFNLVWIDITDNEELNLSDYVDGHSDFSGMDSDFLLELAELMLAHHQSAEAEHFLSMITDAGENQTEYRLLEENLGKRVNPERYTSLLWRMADRPDYAKHLGWFLLGMEDLSGLQSLVSFGEKEFGDTYWTRFFRGVISLYSEDYEKSAEEFVASNQLQRNWSSLYNAALAGAAGGKINDALELLDKAELVLEPGEVSRPEDMVKILLKKAEFLLYLRSYSSAEAVLARIEKIDPVNLHADILRGLLAGESER